MDSVLGPTTLVQGTARSEIYWQKTPTHRLDLRPGDRVVLTMTVTTHLGALYEDATKSPPWAVIAQQHGPFGTPEQPFWGNPEGALVVADGMWQFTAGDQSRGNFWNVKLMPYVDGQTHDVVLDILQSSGSDGWARVWMDGKKVLDTNKPVLQPDSFDGVQIRTGIYTGTMAGPVPAVQRSGTYTNLGLAYFPGPHATPGWQAGVTTPCQRL